MTDLELIFTALGEAATKIYTDDIDAHGFQESQYAAQKGGDTAGKARHNFELDTKRQVISSKNFLKNEDENKELSKSC